MLPNSISQIFSILLLVIAMIFVPVYHSYQKQDDLAEQEVYQAITNFVDNVRTKGYISTQMIEDFESRLTIGSHMFKAEYTHEKKVYIPVYTDPQNPATFTGEYLVDFDAFYKEQIFPHLFDESNPIPKRERKYLLSTGDFFNVKIENMTRTKSSMMANFLSRGNSDDGVNVVIPYGGMILNEDY